jgi:hypothetical protein
MSIASDSNTDTVDRALAAAVKDANKIGELLDALKTARLWLPLPDDGSPVITGTAVTLPTVSYLGSDFVPAYSSAEMLRQLTVAEMPTQATTGGYGGSSQPAVPHAVVRATDLARLLPPSVGIALNAGAAQSVPVYPQGVAYLAGDDDDSISFGPLPPAATSLLAAVSSALATLPQVSRAAAAWLTIQFSGEGLVISVTLDDPGDPAARDAVAAAIEHVIGEAGTAQTDFPVDVTFPGETEADSIDGWFASRDSYFYQR